MSQQGDIPLTLEEALHWLDDRLGKRVSVAVDVMPGQGRRIGVVEGEGVLQQLSEEASEHRFYWKEPDELGGWYVAGDTHFGLTELGDAPIVSRMDEIVVALGDRIILRIFEVPPQADD